MSTSDQRSVILLIEDEKLIAKGYQDGLGRAGFDVRVANDGDMGWRMINELKPDLILLDLRLPIHDGFWILENLAQDKDLKGIPVIILTVIGHKEEVAKAKIMGADDYLIKTEYSLQDIIQRINFRLNIEN